MFVYFVVGFGFGQYYVIGVVLDCLVVGLFGIVVVVVVVVQDQVMVVICLDVLGVFFCYQDGDVVFLVVVVEVFL